MSCQQASRLITTTTTTNTTKSSTSPVTPEDPYVFTETVPTTPPILFNNTQKTRSRPSDTTITPTIQSSPTTVVTSTKLIGNQKLPLSQVNVNVAAKTPTASLAATLAGLTTAVTITSKTAVAQESQLLLPPSSATQQQIIQQNKNKKTTNVCIVRPQQQQQQQQQQQEQQLPTLLLQHTPSLWQTPLLLDTAPAVVSPPTSPASLPSPTAANPQSLTVVPSPPAPPPSSAVATVATVAPLVKSSAAPLPPSKFHHNTLAQHLQKVQCIKKPKKSDSYDNSNSSNNNSNSNYKQQSDVVVVGDEGAAGAVCTKTTVAATTTSTPSPTPQSQAPPPPPPLQAFKSLSQQHSDSSDLNEIPVNVIFRKPQSSPNCERHNTTDDDAGNVQNKPDAMPAEEKTSPTCANKSKKQIRSCSMSPPQQQPPQPPPPPPPVPLLSKPVIHSVNSIAKDVIFVRDNVGRFTATSPPTTFIQPPYKHEMSSTALLNCKRGGTSASTYSSSSSSITPNSRKDVHVMEKALQTDVLHTTPVTLVTAPTKNVNCKKRKVTAAAAKFNTFSPFAQRKNRKLIGNAGGAFYMGDRHNITTNTAVAVVKMSAAQVDADTSVLASAIVLPYCLQQHWLGIYDAVQTVGASFNHNESGNSVRYADAARIGGREERIAQHKTLLMRQALQLLASRPLQRLPLQAARKRLLCVDRLLRKYQNLHSEEDVLNSSSTTTTKQCIVPACGSRALEMASHCQQHITNNVAQQMFMPCTAKFADNTQCRIPVFDIVHDLPLCVEHARKRDAYNRGAYEQQQQRPRKVAAMATIPLLQQQQHDEGILLNSSHNSNMHHNKKLAVPTNLAKTAMLTSTSRKRKSATSNPVGRPQKRAKKAPTNAVASMPLIKVTTATQPSTVWQRKNSTTSHESFTTSNSHSSNMQTHAQPQHYVPNVLAPPALAPLSGLGNGSINNNSNNSNNDIIIPGIINSAHRMLNFGDSMTTTTTTAAATTATMNSAVGAATTHVASDLKAHEINEIVAQFAVAANNTYNNNHSNNSTMNHFLSTNSNSDFTHTSLSSSSSLPSADELLTQDMLSICENSSAYASSEDTGLGGLSESELMNGPHDADDIPLGDTRLLEEHDLANVLSALPVEFSELFTAVRPDERDEVERALELADKHLKSLQQTIESDSDFLADILDVNDEMLPDAADICSKMEIVSSVLHSPETSGIDTSTLFIDSGSNSAGGGSSTNNCTTAADMRGLVQT